MRYTALFQFKLVLNAFLKKLCIKLRFETALIHKKIFKEKFPATKTRIYNL